MTKRGIIALGGASPKFRVSKPTKDVSSTNIADFLMHEDYLFSQIMALGTVTNPGSGGGYEATVDLGYELGDVVHVEVYHVYGTNQYFTPGYEIYAIGTTLIVPNVTWTVSGSSLTIDFGNGWASLAYYVAYKV